MDNTWQQQWWKVWCYGENRTEADIMWNRSAGGWNKFRKSKYSDNRNLTYYRKFFCYHFCRISLAQAFSLVTLVTVCQLRIGVTSFPTAGPHWWSWSWSWLMWFMWLWWLWRLAMIMNHDLWCDTGDCVLIENRCDLLPHCRWVFSKSTVIIYLWQNLESVWGFQNQTVTLSTKGQFQ